MGEEAQLLGTVLGWLFEMTSKVAQRDQIS